MILHCCMLWTLLCHVIPCVVHQNDFNLCKLSTASQQNICVAHHRHICCWGLWMILFKKIAIRLTTVMVLFILNYSCALNICVVGLIPTQMLHIVVCFCWLMVFDVRICLQWMLIRYGFGMYNNYKCGWCCMLFACTCGQQSCNWSCLVTDNVAMHPHLGNTLALR